MPYQYKVLQFSGQKNAKDFENTLNELGAKGWKVVASGGHGGESSQHGFKEGWIILIKDLII